MAWRLRKCWIQRWWKGQGRKGFLHSEEAAGDWHGSPPQALHFQPHPGPQMSLLTVYDTTLIGCSAPGRVEVLWYLSFVVAGFLSVYSIYACTHPSMVHPSSLHACMHPTCTHILMHPSIIHPSIHHVHIHPSIHHVHIYPCIYPSNFSLLQILPIHTLSTGMNVGCRVFENIHSWRIYVVMQKAPTKPSVCAFVITQHALDCGRVYTLILTTCFYSPTACLLYWFCLLSQSHFTMDVTIASNKQTGKAGWQTQVTHLYMAGQESELSLLSRSKTQNCPVCCTLYTETSVCGGFYTFVLWCNEEGAEVAIN